MINGLFFSFVEFLRRFKPSCEPPAKRPVGRPKKQLLPPEKTTSNKAEENEEQFFNLDSDNDADSPSPKKQKRGHYRTYSLHYKMAVLEEVYTGERPICTVADKYNIPRSTILSWESQLRGKNKECPASVRGIHLRSGSGRKLSYPPEIDDELCEWILIRRDAHLPVGRELIKTKAKQLVIPHNTQFVASSGWLEKFLIRHGMSLRCRTSISQKLPAQLEHKLECFMNEIRVLRTINDYTNDLIINMDETPMYFDMVPERTVSKKGVKEVRVRSSGGEKKRLTVVLTCTGNGKMLPALAIFKGKRKLKFKSPANVCVAVQAKGWMDTELMMRWLKGIVLPYTQKRKALLVIDSFSAHESTEFIEEARKNNVHVAIIPGGCTSKIQPLDVCLNKPFKSILRRKWLEYIESVVEEDRNPTKLPSPSKETCCDWIMDGLQYFEEKERMVEQSFKVCGITNALNGSENSLIHCTKELASLQVPYVDEAEEDPFGIEPGSESETDETADSDDDF